MQGGRNPHQRSQPALPLQSSSLWLLTCSPDRSQVPLVPLAACPLGPVRPALRHRHLRARRLPRPLAPQHGAERPLQHPDRAEEHEAQRAGQGQRGGDGLQHRKGNGVWNTSPFLFNIVYLS